MQRDRARVADLKLPGQPDRRSLAHLPVQLVVRKGPVAVHVHVVEDAIEVVVLDVETEEPHHLAELGLIDFAASVLVELAEQVHHLLCRCSQRVA